MSLLKANLAALRVGHPAVAAVVEALPPVASRGAWSPSRSGPPAVRLSGTSLTSAFDPVAEAQKAVPLWEGGVDFAVLVGLGAGYLVEAVASRYPDLPLVIAEPDPHWFAEVLAHRDLVHLCSNPRVIPVLGPDARAVGDFFRPLACRSIELVFWRPVAQLFPFWGDAVKDQVAEAQAQATVNGATFRRFGDLWLRNLAKNEAHARELQPLATLAGWGRGIPAVVAAAGPSLADRFNWMKRHRHQFLLIAVDTAWSALSAQGLEPDVLLVLDGQYWNSRHLDLPLPSPTLVVTEWIGPPRAFRLAPGRTYVAASSVPFLRAWESQRWGHLGPLGSGGSVATAAWSLAVHLGCSEVAFAGLDLGFPRGQTHVPGSQFEEALHRRSTRLSPAETRGLALRGLAGLAFRQALDGGQVLSDPRMDLYRRWITRAVTSRPDVRAVNLGTRGSLIPGLLGAEPDYGDAWPPASLPEVPFQSHLARLPGSPNPPPFSLLSRVVSGLGAEEFDKAVEEAWQAARTFWGREVWDSWTGRAKTTWDRWPSPRSRQELEEVVSLTLRWRDFTDLP